VLSFDAGEALRRSTSSLVNMSVTATSRINVGRALIASLVSPGITPILTYLVLTSADVVLPDHVASRAFLFEAAMFYIFALPAFWFLYLARRGIVMHVIVGAFVTWPAWLLITSFPSDASVDPVNPQFFFAPTTTIFGTIAGALFFAITGSSKYRADRIA
jgi:hypothetical protein